MSTHSKIENFNFISKKILLDIIENVCKNYQGYWGTRSKDNKLLFEIVRNILSQDAIAIENLNNPEYVFKIIGQFKKLSGIIAYKKRIEITELTIRNSDATLSVINEGANNFMSLDRWDQHEFLTIHFFLLLKLYVHIKRSIITYLPINKSTLEEYLINEIVITINAFKIRKTYDLIAKENNTELLNIFIEKFILLLQKKSYTMKEYEELNFPCGYDSHAIYLNFVRIAKKLILRLDNLSPNIKGPYLLTEINFNKIQFNKELKRYLINICLAKYMCQKESLPIIYNEGNNKSMLPNVNIKINYPIIEKQIVENCVVENFKVGMLYRLAALNVSPPNLLLNWIINAETRLAFDFLEFA